MFDKVQVIAMNEKWNFEIRNRNNWIGIWITRTTCALLLLPLNSTETDRLTNWYIHMQINSYHDDSSSKSRSSSSTYGSLGHMTEKKLPSFNFFSFPLYCLNCFIYYLVLTALWDINLSGIISDIISNQNNWMNTEISPPLSFSSLSLCLSPSFSHIFMFC